MRHFCLFLFIILVSAPALFAQFAPVGATWHYDERFAFSGDVAFVKAYIEKDTMYQGELCQKLVKDRYFICMDQPEPEYFFERNDKVFRWEPVYQQFQVLYDFTAVAGDSWTFQFQEWGVDTGHVTDTIQVMVDSVGTISVNNFILKQLFVTYRTKRFDGYHYYSSTIIEKLGDIQYLLNWGDDYNIVCDANWGWGLRCYEDNVLGVHQRPNQEACEYIFNWISVEEQAAAGSFSVFPNPTESVVQIQLHAPEQATMEVIDLTGKVVLNTSMYHTASLDLSELSPSIYLLRVQQEGLQPVYQKVVKR